MLLSLLSSVVHVVFIAGQRLLEGIEYFMYMVLCYKGTVF